MALRSCAMLALLGGVSLSIPAQTPGALHDDLQAAMAKAQAAAHRPGDESLSCEALEGELVSVAKDSALQTTIAKRGAEAQAQLDAVNAASGQMVARTAFSFFSSVVSSVVPGAGMVGQAAAAAQAQAQAAQAAQNIEQRIQQAQEMMAFMPQIMRGQRVVELAQARDCAWVRAPGSP